MKGLSGQSNESAGQDPGRTWAYALCQREGVSLALACAPAVLGAWAYGTDRVLQTATVGIPVAAATLLFLLGGALPARIDGARRLFTAAGVLLLLGMLAPALLTSPAATLAGGVSALLLLVRTLQRGPSRTVPSTLPPASRAACRVRAAAIVAVVLLVGVFTFHDVEDPLVQGGVGAACLLTALLSMAWAGRAGWPRLRSIGIALALLLGAVEMVLGAWYHVSWLVACASWCLAALCVARARERSQLATTPGWEPIVTHPARLLLTTFLGLAMVGTLLLVMPWATSQDGNLRTIDAAFTAVSAVCVTGLIVVDTPTDLSGPGQIVVLILIQLGGLGIMSITTVVLHALGRRLSLKHEGMLATMGTTSRDRLAHALRRVIVFAVIVEALGALLLTGLFALHGDAWGAAIPRGIFTSVSAFCNAGFALQTDSLMGYQTSPLVLHTVAILIVLGGLSPVAALAIPSMLRRRRQEPAVKMVLVVTVLLLVGGAVVYGIFEWNSSLNGLSVADHLHNAWFQSVTLRTAGFNSVDMVATRPETRLMMMSLMFIGGSPGGTAGGIKTTTFAVLVLAVWTAVTGRNRVLVAKREILPGTIVRAIAVLGTGVLSWLIVVVFLLLTQTVAAQDLVYEATSAIGTVGLTTGATAQLDSTGKSIIMAAMFFGRVGPLTLFTLLSDPRPRRNVGYPEATIPIA